MPTVSAENAPTISHCFLSAANRFADISSIAQYVETINIWTVTLFPRLNLLMFSLRYSIKALSSVSDYKVAAFVFFFVKVEVLKGIFFGS